jgi:uncharacterized protein YkwD
VAVLLALLCAVLAVPAFGARADECGVAGLGSCDGGTDEEPPPADEDEPPPPEPTLVDETDHVLGLINDERAQHDLAPLARHGYATDVAEPHSLDMAEAESIWHNEKWMNYDTLDTTGAKKIAENVGMSRDVDDIHRLFMESAPHRANILDPDLTHVGLAVASDGDGWRYVTQGFLELRTSTTTSAPAASSGSPSSGSPQTAKAPAASPATSPAPAPAAPPAAASAEDVVVSAAAGTEVGIGDSPSVPVTVADGLTRRAAPAAPLPRAELGTALLGIALAAAAVMVVRLRAAEELQASR